MQTPGNNAQMVAGPAGTKMVKIQAVRDIRLEREEKIKGQSISVEKIVKAGEVAEVTEEEAKEFCDTVFQGSYAFGGERHEQDGDTGRHQIVRAKRVV